MWQYGMPVGVLKLSRWLELRSPRRRNCNCLSVAADTESMSPVQDRQSHRSHLHSCTHAPTGPVWTVRGGKLNFVLCRQVSMPLPSARRKGPVGSVMFCNCSDERIVDDRLRMLRRMHVVTHGLWSHGTHSTGRSLYVSAVSS